MDESTVKMRDSDYRHFLNLLMCSDPWPVSDKTSEPAMISLANREAKLRGFPNWVVAYHDFAEKPEKGNDNEKV